MNLSRTIYDTAELMGIEPTPATPENSRESEALRLFRILSRRNPEALEGIIEAMGEGETQAATLEAMRAAVAALPTIH